MEWLICGSVPDADFPLTSTRYALEKGELVPPNGGVHIPVLRGTPALAAACILACETLGTSVPELMLAGDTGDGRGSAELYSRLSRRLADPAVPRPGGITFHYLFPDLDGHNRVLMALDDGGPRPILAADAGFMYVAKMSGYAASYDLFTPDIGELAFLADEHAPHPFYTRGFLLAEEKDVCSLIKRAYEHGNCAHTLLVKGAQDCIAQEGAVTARIKEPCVPFMEPIGGTGDLVTGLATGLLAAGFPMRRACVTAAYANRIVGTLANPTPAAQVAELLPFVAESVERALRATEDDGAFPA